MPCQAEDEPVQEPSALESLAQARDAYEVKVKAAVDPITAAYLKDLDRMMKSYGAKGDLESALAVQNEIKSLKTLATQVTVVGKWTWDGHDKEFLENGVFIGGQHKIQGTWKAVDKRVRTYQISWFDEKGKSNGYVDLLRMSSDGSTLFGKNNEGHVFIGKRINGNSAPAEPGVKGEQTSKINGKPIAN
jgi:hypothetical protein